MPADIDDPRLTAYALDELAGAEREEVDALLRDDASARRVVEEIRATASLLTDKLRAEVNTMPAVPLPSIQPRRRRLRPRFILAVASGLAAAAIGVAILLPAMSKARYASRSVASMGQIGQASLLYSNDNKGLYPSTSSNLSTMTRNAPANGGVLYGDGHASFEKNPFNATQRDTVYVGALPAPMDADDRILVPTKEGDLTLSGFKSNNALGGELRAARDVESEGLTRGRPASRPNTEAYDRINDNPFLDVIQNPLSTFSIDVDTASYSNVRRFLTQGQLPPKDAVRIEEMINYFPYSYVPPKGDREGEAPFAANVEVAGCPWNAQHRLVRVGLKGREIKSEHRPASNLVFLIDVSGSMEPANKLPLLKRAMTMLLGELRENDRVAIAVYAGNSGLVMPSTACDDSGKRSLLNALENLSAGGSTNGAQGIELAYQLATSNFITGGCNRVILCTDGDFNVGITDQGSLTRLIEDKAKSGVFLSVLGFGMGNTKDSTMEKLADKGNGNYAYIDTLSEAKKVLVEQMSGTLVTIAKDVKIQIEFNPAKVGAYRLIGYENRMLAKEDFNDDKKDAGEIGAGHTVTALYEIAPPGAKPAMPSVDPLKYQQTAPRATSEPFLPGSNELLTLKLRYKAPDAPLEQGTSKLLEFPVTDSDESFANASQDFKFASAVAGFGMILRDSPHRGTITFDRVIEIAQEGSRRDDNAYRAEFVDLVRRAKTLSK